MKNIKKILLSVVLIAFATPQLSALTIEDYYSTDTHWKQEDLGNVVDVIAKEMNFSEFISKEYEKVEVGDFYGVYNGQAALPLDADKISYLTNETLKNAEVKIFDEKRNEKQPHNYLEFYIQPEEKKFDSLADVSIQNFISRIIKLKEQLILLKQAGLVTDE